MSDKWAEVGWMPEVWLMIESLRKGASCVQKHVPGDPFIMEDEVMFQEGGNGRGSC